MQRLVIKTLSLFLGLSPAAAFCQAQFTAKMFFTTMVQERTYNIYSSEAGYRYEFNEDGMEGVIIVKKGSSEVIILIPQQKMAMKGSSTDPMSMGNDPVASYEHFRKEGVMKVEGKEMVNGVSCTRSGLWKEDNPDQKMYTVWTSEEYNFPIKMINHLDGSGDATMELKEIKPWTPDAKSFEIPDGYQVISMPKI